MKKQFAVFGLGRFGGSLVKEFYKQGIEVLAIDKSEEKIQQYAQYATHAVRANGVDERSLKKLGVKNVDHAFVSYGDDIEASILTSLLLKELGIPKVWAKAQNDYHQKVLDKIGVDRVIHPERDMAKRIAHHIISEKMIDYIELSKEYSLVEIVATKKLYNKTISDLDIATRYGCNVVGIQRGEEICVSPSMNEKIVMGDVLLIIGKNKDIVHFEEVGM
ncbi:potassium channel family protein [Metabacillus niabensis]|uniref:Trk system potassium uptake protein TrkA n=1 Tax=Metabacillus niabensis TaxID=324854 RepID=A0ABT9YZL7_9BACI|nr:TrkA family potassium uptake protein [Metabacillus niabensis]MDQ0225447.1 trk system potassium uptake protein TrkA [Metabacillus niabensis]